MSKPWGPLPVCRINTIMRSSSDAENIGKESPMMMAKAAELFIRMLAKQAYQSANKEKKLDYKDIAEIVNQDEKYEFLKDIMPRKITYAEYKRMQGIEDKEEEEESSSDEDSDSEDSSSDDVDSQ